MNHADLPPRYVTRTQKFFDELGTKRQASSNKQVTSKPDYDIIKTERIIMEDKEAIIEEVIAICEANKKNMYCDKYQLIDMIREVLKLYEN